MITLYASMDKMSHVLPPKVSPELSGKRLVLPCLTAGSAAISISLFISPGLHSIRSNLNQCLYYIIVRFIFYQFHALTPSLFVFDKAADRQRTCNKSVNKDSIPTTSVIVLVGGSETQ